MSGLSLMREHAEKAELGVPASVPSAAFGTHRPGALQAMLIGLARRCPHNRGGRIAALALRKLLLWTPLWAARFLSERGTIVCFEPNPQAHARLAFNLEVNRRKRPGSWPRIHALNVGVSDRDEMLAFHLHPANLGAGSLVVASPHRSTTQIPCVTLLRQLQDLQVEHVDVLKIDIEGAEEQALRPFLQAAPESLLLNAMIIEIPITCGRRICARASCSAATRS
jgi:FkbM family methyltransferase